MNRRTGNPPDLSGDIDQQLPRRRLLGAVLAAAVLPAAAAQGDEPVRVALQPADGARHFSGFITEYEAVAYLVPLRQGESVQVVLASNNAANCFDIHAPGINKPIYVGSESGNQHRLVATRPGDYIIRVFLLRFAARDGQSADYTLQLQVMAA